MWNGSECVSNIVQVECTENEDCTDFTKPVCNADTNICESCPNGEVWSGISCEPVFEGDIGGECESGSYLWPDGTCKEDVHCNEQHQFWNAYTQTCTACPTEGNPVENKVDDEKDSCLKCTSAKIDVVWMGGSYCVYCPSNRAVCGDQCCRGDQECKRDSSTGQKKCVSKLNEGECLSNADCGAGQYCQNEPGCARMVGTCQPATLYNGGISIDVYGTDVYRSQENMGWYAARNFCSAHGKRLFASNLKNYCTNKEWTSIKNNGYGNCVKLAMTNDFEWGGWTGTADNSCNMLAAGLNKGWVNNSPAGNSIRPALCE